jgi:hypothetical protein
MSSWWRGFSGSLRGFTLPDASLRDAPQGEV